MQHYAATEVLGYIYWHVRENHTGFYENVVCWSPPAAFALLMTGLIEADITEKQIKDFFFPCDIYASHKLFLP